MPTPTRSFRLLTSATAAAVGLVVLAACGGPDDVPPREPIEQMVALGDSYSSGPDLNPVTDTGCHRSGANYAALAAKALGVKDLEDRTCGGANTGNLIQAQQGDSGSTINPPQLQPINAKTDLVTLGIGLNDSGISAKTLYICLPEFQAQFAAACQQFLAQPDSAVLSDVSMIAEHVKLAIDAIRDLNPSTRILLIGYPRSLPDDADCPAQLPVTEAAADKVRLTLKSVDLAYRKLAKEKKIRYLSTYDASIGHELCSADPWVNGSKASGTDGQGAALHPTPAYMSWVADRIAEIYRK